MIRQSNPSGATENLRPKIIYLVYPAATAMDRSLAMRPRFCLIMLTALLTSLSAKVSSCTENIRGRSGQSPGSAVFSHCAHK